MANKIFLLEGKIIKYAGEKYYIGIAKLPLMPNPNKIGYKGVKMQNPEKTLLMCFECLEMRKDLTSHMRGHGMTIWDYKKKYGYNQQTALISDDLAKRRSEMAANRDQSAMVVAYQKSLTPEERKAQSKKVAEIRKRNDTYIFSAEFKNHQGTCAEQIKERLRNFIDRFHRLPGARTIGADSAALYQILRLRFGSIQAALKHYQLPLARKYGWYTEYIFKDGERITTSKKNPKSYEKFYKKIKATSSLYSNK